MATYTYVKPGADLTKLQSELIAAGLPIDYLNGSGDQVFINTLGALSPAQVATMGGVVAAHDGRPRQPRPLLTLNAAITALSTAQKNAIAADLYGAGNKWATDSGPNRGSLFVLWLLTQLGLSAAQTTAAKIAGAAMFAQDQVSYLVRPAFDPTINIPGDEPVP